MSESQKAQKAAEAAVTTGWGSLVNARDAHYFEADGRSLCNRWLAFGTPIWESNQELGTEPTPGTCKTCWKKLAARLGRARGKS